MLLFSEIFVGLVFSLAVASNPPYTQANDMGFLGRTEELNPNIKGVSLTDYLVRSRSDRDTDSQQINSIPSTPVISSCAAFIDYFGEVSANFTRCVVSFARPLRVCEHCVEEYLRAKSAFNLVMTEKHKDDHNMGCGVLILNSDRIQIIVRTWGFSRMLWNDCNCEKCFQFAENKNDTISYQLSNDTIEFQALAKKTIDCFSNYSLIIPIRNGTHNRSLVCAECAHYYQDLNELYSEIVQHSHHHVCMDIVDTINTTRLEWSQEFGCSLKRIDPMPVFIISGLFCLLPIGFYLGNCIYVTRQQNNAIGNKSNGNDHPELEDTTDNNDSS